MIQGIIFDKDGTLFDFNATWGAWTKGLLLEESGGDRQIQKRLAHVLGYDAENEVFYPHSIVIGHTADEVAEAILPLVAPQTKADLIARLDARAATAPQIEATPLEPLMEGLRERGLKIGVVTNDSEAPARAHLAKSGIEDRVDFIAGHDSGHGAKPEPGPLLAFCRDVGLRPEQCAMVGDSTHDLRAGRAAGMICIGVLTGPAALEELAPFADVVLPSIADLPGWLSA